MSEDHGSRVTVLELKVEALELALQDARHESAERDTVIHSLCERVKALEERIAALQPPKN